MNRHDSQMLGEYLRSDMLRGTRADYKKYLNLRRGNILAILAFFVFALIFLLVVLITGTAPMFVIVPFALSAMYMLYGRLFTDGREGIRQIMDWINFNKLKTLRGDEAITHSEKVFNKLIKSFDRAYRKGYNKSFYDIYIINTNPQSLADTYGNSFWFTLAAGKRIFAKRYQVLAKTNLKVLRAFTYVAQKNPALRDYYGF